MVVLLVIAAPILIFQMAIPSRPLLVGTRAVLILATGAVSVQFWASLRVSMAPILVPIACMLGFVALVMCVQSSSSKRLPVWLAGVGAGCNFIPIALYGAMPVGGSSRYIVTDSPIAESWVTANKHIEVDLDSEGAVRLLADIIPISPIGIVSIGDLLIIAAFASLLAENISFLQTLKTVQQSGLVPGEAAGT